MKISKALVTIVVGEKYTSLWEKHARPSWLSYCEKYDYDLVVISEMIDKSERANGRSVSWQKCLILGHEKVRHYDVVVWMDSDIVINDLLAPDIVQKVPQGKVGCVDTYSFYTRENSTFLYDIFLNEWRVQKIHAIANRTGREFYQQYGINTDHDDVVQAGVLVASPKFHHELFEQVYYNYEEKGGAEWNYEMRPLSYEIVNRNIHYFINERFNYNYDAFKKLYYPQLTKEKGKVFSLNKKRILRESTSAAFVNAYFLHFAGCMDEMIHLNANVKSHSDFLLSSPLKTFLKKLLRRG